MGKDFLSLQSCFGYHTDLHLSEKDLDAGTRAIPDELEAGLREIAPDWAQVDCKGHRGYTSYFSKVPESSIAPHLVHDAVAAWSEAARRLNIQLIGHYSSFLDLAAALRHPEWMAVPAPGHVRSEPLTISDAWMCPRSEYFDKLMIPQLIELAVDYRLDGIWIDGDIWGFRGCWCERCKAEFRRRTGIAEIPEKPGCDHWPQWYRFQMDSYQECIQHYIRTVKAAAPDFRICCNWLESSRYPMQKDLPIDWISGDVAPRWTLDDLHFEARWLANRKKPWDLMSWGHLGEPDFHLKTPDMLCQEAAPVIAAGGRYIFCENIVGIRSSQQVPWRMRQFRRVRDFIKEHAPYCRGSEGVPEIALLHDNSPARDCRNPGDRLILCTGAACSMLLDNHYGVDVLDTRMLLPRLGEFPVVVVPEIGSLRPELVDALKSYVEAGGRLLVSGVDNIADFGADYFGFAHWRVETESPLQGRTWYFAADKDATPLYFLSNGADGCFPLASSKWGLGTAIPGAAGAEELFASYVPEESATGLAAFCMKRHGRGIAAAIPADFFTGYFRHYCLPEARRFLGRVLKRLLPERAVEVEAPTVVDVMFRRKNGCLLIHLLNRSSGIATCPNRVMIDEIPPVGPVTLRIRLETRPASVRVLPADREIDYEWLPSGEKAGSVLVTVPSVRILETVKIHPENN